VSAVPIPDVDAYAEGLHLVAWLRAGVDRDVCDRLEWALDDLAARVADLTDQLDGWATLLADPGLSLGVPVADDYTWSPDDRPADQVRAP
jgi:hypothetical protein